MLTVVEDNQKMSTKLQHDTKPCDTLNDTTESAAFTGGRWNVWERQRRSKKNL